MNNKKHSENENLYSAIEEGMDQEKRGKVKPMKDSLKKIRAGITKGKSPLENIPRTKLNISTQEIVEILQECRAGI